MYRNDRRPSSRTEAPVRHPFPDAQATGRAQTPQQRDSAVDRGTSRPPIERIALRLDELAQALGLSRRTIERERSSGRFPRPDLKIGKTPLWRPETIHRWVEEEGRL